MLSSTTFDIPGYRIIALKGMVLGIIVRSATIAQGILGGLKSIIGGRIGAYTEMCEQGPQHAYDAIVAHPFELGANAIVGVRYDASYLGAHLSATEVLCYGTAVMVEPLCVVFKETLLAHSQALEIGSSFSGA